jgi:hypothetical protein
MRYLKPALVFAACLGAFAAQAGITTTNVAYGAAGGQTLANVLVGSGITVSNAVLAGDGAEAGTFTGGNSAGLGFDSGVVLTTGALSCIPGPNSTSSCTGPGRTSSLSFDFTSNTGQVFFQFVFGSEEYNEWVGSQFNDEFDLLLNGVNIALVPGGGGVVSVNNVNCISNAAYYRNNIAAGASPNCPNLGLDVQYDGLTTVLTASGNLNAGVNTFTFAIRDVSDAQWDSGVFIRAGSFSSNPIPEPGSLALVAGSLLGLGFMRRRKA